MEFSILLISLIILAGFIKGFIGFGLSLVLITVLFELGFETYQLMPILVPIFVVLDIFLFYENRNNVKLDFKENFTLHPTTLMTLFIGMLLGTYLITIIDTTYLKLFFAILILILIFFMLEKVDIHQMRYPSERMNGIFGSVTGFLTGLFTMNAVPTSLYLLYHQYPKEKYMGALVTFLVMSDILLVAVYLYSELFSFELLQTSAIFLVITLVGFLIGTFVRRFIPGKYFKSMVIFILALNSLKILFDFIF